MPQAQVATDVRKVSDKVRVIDVKGELTAFAESVLSWTPTTRPAMGTYGRSS